ncbi:MAG: NAD(P)H-binding protein [Streptosporangiaceae bacterium]
MILVTGATGNVGAEVMRALVASGQRVRALTRTDDPVELPAGAEQVTGDLNKPESMRAPLTGTSGIFLYPGYQDLTATLAEARRDGVRQVVLLSGSSAASGDMSNAITRYMSESETAVRESGLAWTIVRSFGFMSNTLQWIPQLKAGDVVRAAFAGVPVAMIDPYDIAAVAATALTSGQHDGKTYTVSGPEPLRPADRLAILGEVLGRDLTFEAQPDDEARAEMSNSMPAEYVDAFFDFYVAGHLDESQVQPDVHDLTGRAPRTFRQWAQAHASAFPARAS